MRDPSLRELHAALRTVAVTGTNGKTTTTGMIASIVEAAGEVPARVTTVGAWVGATRIAEAPDFADFRATAARAGAAGARTLALETTSKALEGGFARSWRPRVAVFTNLTRDHLDRHHTPERYLAAKAQLFLALEPGGRAVLNAADPASALLAEVLPPGTEPRAYAGRPVSDACRRLPLALAAEHVGVTRDGTRIGLAPSPLAAALGGTLTLAVHGVVHAENALAAALAADALGYDAAAIAAGLRGFAGTPGRFELVANGERLVVVDYAHTPDALEGTLRTARALAQERDGRVVCVFGCGGERDAGKRPAMGAVASVLADLAVLTTDNPRHEPPEAIADAVESGRRGAARWVREPDRARAIALALEQAGPRDVVVVAGKGHERTQQVGDALLPFSDAETVRALLGATRR